MAKKILIVDDEPDVLEVLSRRLIHAGYAVIKASSGPEAVEKAKKEQPDLVILDIVMPGMSGGDVAGILKEDSTTKDIPVIFLTCLYTRDEEKKEGYVIKENFLVAKPYDPTEILELIHTALTNPHPHNAREEEKKPGENIY